MLLSHVDYFGPSILETYIPRIVFLTIKMYTYLFLKHFEMIYHINHFIAFFLLMEAKISKIVVFLVR